LESFIRAKYEQRKWIAKEWIPPEITVSSDVSVVLFFIFCLIIKINKISNEFCFLADGIRNKSTKS
jgi:hypothetical protein